MMPDKIYNCSHIYAGTFGFTAFFHPGYSLILAAQLLWIMCTNSLGANAVMQREHKRLGTNVKLQIYDGFTSLDAPMESTNIEEISLIELSPAKPIVKRVSHVMAHFVEQHQPSLCDSLEKLCVQINFDIDDESEVGFIHLLPSKGSEKVIDWNAECEAKLESFFKSFTSSLLSVHSELLPLVSKIVTRIKPKKSICAQFSTKNETALHIAGCCAEVTEIVEEIKHIEDTELTKEESVNVDKKRIAYIDQIYQETLRNSHPGVCFTLNIEENTILINGRKNDIAKFKASLADMKCCSVSVSIAQEITQYLTLSDDRCFVKRLLQIPAAPVAVYFDADVKILFILAKEKAVASTFVKQVEQNIGFEVINSATLLGRVYEDKQFKVLCEELKEEFIVDIIVLPSEIKIIGDHQLVNKVKSKVNQYIQDEYIGKRKLEVCKGKWRFISKHLRLQWDKIVSILEANSQYEDVLYQFPNSTDDNPVIYLEGEESLITSLFQQITTLVDSICTNDPPMIIDRPGLLQFLATKEAEFAIKGIEVSVPACIEYTIRPPDEADIVTNKTLNEICRGTTREGKRILLIVGDIENFPVNVIVNTTCTDDKSKHDSGVALAIAKKGGSKIQKDFESYRKIHSPLIVGNAILRDEVGSLPCKKIVYAVVPFWKNGEHYEDRQLKKVCIRALQVAEKCESIAFPAISSGSFYKFPIHICANTMLQAICQWSEEFPRVTLQDIYIVVHKHAVSAFTDAMKKVLTMVPQNQSAPTSSVNPTNTVAVTPSRRKRKGGSSSEMDTITSTEARMSNTSQPLLVPIHVCKGELLKETVNPSQCSGCNVKFCRFNDIEICYKLESFSK